MAKIVHMIIGAVGTGKTHLTSILSKAWDVKILSADDIEIGCKGKIDESDIDGEIMECFFWQLDQEDSFILDGLNLTIDGRKTYIRQAKASGFDVYVYDLGPGNKQSLERRLRDNRGISKERWVELAKSNIESYQKPTKKLEGMNKLYTLY